MPGLVLTNGVYARELGRLPPDLVAFNTDLRIGQRATSAQIEISQGDISLTLDRHSSIIFLPFRSPLEASDIKAVASALYDNLALLLTLQNLGFSIRNDPGAWLRAYDRSILFALADIIDVPAVELVQGLGTLRLPQDGAQYLVKSGLGIKKSHRGAYLSPTLVPEGVKQLRVPKGQRYAIQQHVAAEREARLYIVRNGRNTHTLAFDMPIGTPDAPDWREETLAKRLRVSGINDGSLERLGAAIIARLGLNYVCLDLLFADNRWHLVDVNPHGTWSWLPKKSAEAVRELVKETLSY